MKARLIGIALSAAAAATIAGCGVQSAARPAAQSSAPAAAVTTPQPQKTVYVQQPPPATVTVPAAQPPVIIQQAPRTVIVSPAPVPGTDSVGDGGNFYPINSQDGAGDVAVGWALPQPASRTSPTQTKPTRNTKRSFHDRSVTQADVAIISRTRRPAPRSRC